jgi:hypothetical protein
MRNPLIFRLLPPVSGLFLLSQIRPRGTQASPLNITIAPRILNSLPPLVRLAIPSPWPSPPMGEREVAVGRVQSFASS